MKREYQDIPSLILGMTLQQIEDELLMREMEFRSKYCLNQEQEMPL